jgi:hypothetical protein
MKLMNRTTNINAEKTIMEIERLLAEFKASHVMKEYSSEGKVTSLSFKMEGRAYQIPANITGVFQVMFGNKRHSGRRDAMKNREEQAYKTAWRIIKDWVHAQLSIVLSGQSVPEEVLLPYLWDGKRTLFQAYKEGRLQIENKKDDE